MNIVIKPVGPGDLVTFEKFAVWDADPDIKPFIIPRQTMDEIKDPTGKELMDAALKNVSKTIYAVYDDDKLIGTSSLDINFSHLKSEEEYVGWISIVIGDKSYWGKGVSKIIMNDLEVAALDMGCDYIELGVFEFNKRAQKLYLSMGYKVIATIKNFVYYNGKWHDDIRMLKKISD